MHNKRKTRNRAGRLLIALAAMQMAAWCQAPVVSKVVDAASYTPTLGAPGSIATIFGTNLASAKATAPGVPLPHELGGTRVTWNGVAAPLFFVSPTQINFQVPSPNDTTPGVLVTAGGVVSTAAGNSVPYKAPFDAWYAAGIFSMDGSGCGQGAVLNVAADGVVSVNSAANSVSPGDSISVYGTGADNYPNYPPAGGVPTPLTPPFKFSPAGPARFDFQDLLSARSPSFTGAAPGLVGVDQFNIQIPATVREGCAVPLQVQYDGTSSAITQPVTLAIRKGGGPCMDPPTSGYGQINWQRTISETLTNDRIEPIRVSRLETLTVSLQSSPGMKAPPVPVYGKGLPSSRTYLGPSCLVPGYRSLEAGTVTTQGPGLSTTAVPVAVFPQGQLSGLSAYQATLPNVIQAGMYTVTASGGADVGAFQTAAQIGADIQIQTPLTGSILFGRCNPVKIDWTGGDPNSWVTVRLIQQVRNASGDYQFVNFAFQARTSDGTLTTLGTAANVCLPAPNVISIEVDPDPSEVTTFSASGLSLGGQATWKYVHTFQVLP